MMAAGPREIAAVVDGLLAEHSQFDGLRLLNAFEWIEPLPIHLRSETPAVLHLRCPRPDAEALMNEAAAYADALGLLRRHPSRSPLLAQAMSALRPAAYGLEVLLRQVRERPGGRPQLDLFQDNRLSLIEARLRSALIQHDLYGAQAGFEQLLAQPSSVATRQAWRALVDALAAGASNPGSLWSAMEGDLPVLARRYLAAGAPDYLRHLWRQLAAATAGQAFEASVPLRHASHAWMQAREWQRVCDSVEADREWQSQPLLWLRLIEARQALGAVLVSRRLWLQLCWQFPDTAEAALQNERADPTLNLQWQLFLDAEPVLEVVHFPAWLLLVDASERRWSPPPSSVAAPVLEVYRALQQLLASDGTVSARRRLQALHPDLLPHYLERRK